jgi:hypothetical protein
VESSLYGLYFPPDLESAHRYFEIDVRVTKIYTLRLYRTPELPLLGAFLGRLQITGPFEDVPDAAGRLARAIVAGEADAVRVLVAEGADVNAGLPDWTPLEAAAYCDRRDIAAMLARDPGLDAAFRGDTALTPFFLALIAGRPEIAGLLVDQGAGSDRSVETKGLPPLALAAVFGYPGPVSRLIERGAAVDVRAPDGKTPLMFACESRSQMRPGPHRRRRRPGEPGRRRRDRSADDGRLGEPGDHASAPRTRRRRQYPGR